MKDDLNPHPKKESRRSFIRSKLLATAIGATGLPLLAKQYNKEETSSQPKGISKFLDGNSSWDDIRSQFYLQEGRHFFNTAGLGPSPQPVVDAICESLKHLASVAKSGHKERDIAHKKIAEFLSVDPSEIAVTRNATEGINIVARSLNLKAGDEIILTRHEHIGGSAPWIALQKDLGVVVKLVELDLTGRNNYKIIKENITDRTKVVSFSHITCTTGMRLPAKKIVKLCRQKGIYSCVDGAQAVGMMKVNLKKLKPDFYAASGHKWLFGPKGTGILYMNKMVINECKPTFVGAYTDSKFDLDELLLEYRDVAEREEYGTRSASTLVGLSTAVDFNTSIGIERIEKRGLELAQQFIDQIIDDDKFELLSPVTDRYRAAIVTFRIKDKDSLQVRDLLARKHNYHIRRIYEHHLDAMRISFSVYNTEKEVSNLTKLLKKIAAE